MKDFFSASDLSRYNTIEELERAKDYFIDIRNDMTRKLIRKEDVFADEYYKVENMIHQIDSEIERRRYKIQFSSPKGRCAVAIMSSQNYNQVPPYYLAHTQPQPTPAPNTLLPMENENLRNQLTGKNKEIKILRKRLEEQSKELQEERNHSDKLQNLIDSHSCNDGSTFSDIEEDQEDE